MSVAPAKDTDDLTQDARSDQQCFLNAVTLPAGASGRVCFRLQRAFPSTCFPPEKFPGGSCVDVNLLEEAAATFRK